MSTYNLLLKLYVLRCLKFKFIFINFEAESEKFHSGAAKNGKLYVIDKKT